MATSPKYPQSAISGSVAVSTANTNTDGTGTLATVYTGTSGGNDEIDTIFCAATGATTQGMLRFWLYDGSVYQLVGSIIVPPNTPSITEGKDVWKAIYQFETPVRLPTTSHVLKCGTHIAEAFKVTAQGNSYV